MVEDTEEIETEFEVERILAQRLGQDGKVKYLVKWKDYADHESTWEAIEQFSDVTTIREWEVQRDKGDVLDGIALDHLLNRIADYLAGEQPLASGTESAPSNTHADHEFSLEPPKKRQKTSQLIDGPLPLLKNRPFATSKNSSSSSERVGRPSSTAMAVANPADIPPTGKVSQGTPFRNLQHMGRARKKAAEETPVNPDDPGLKMISFGPASPKLSPMEDDSLFFPEVGAAEPSKEPAQSTKKPPSPQPVSHQDLNSPKMPVLTKKLLTNIKMSKDTLDTSKKDPKGNIDTSAASALSATPGIFTQIIHVAPGPPPAPVPSTAAEKIANYADSSGANADSSKTAPNPPPNRAAMKAVNGLSWKKNELVVHITIGEHDIGPVKIVDMDNYARACLFNLKKQFKSYEIRLKFQHEKVIPSTSISEMSSSWTNYGNPAAPVVPFDESAQPCQEFSEHLQRHDSTAIWTHPNTDLVLLMFAPRSVFWQNHSSYRGRQTIPELVIESRRLEPTIGPAPVKPVSKATPVCKYWASDGCCSFGDQCWFSHPAQSSQEPSLVAARHSSPLREAQVVSGKSGRVKGELPLKDERPLPRRRMSEAGPQRAQSNVEAKLSKNAESLSRRRMSEAGPKRVQFSIDNTEVEELSRRVVQHVDNEGSQKPAIDNPTSQTPTNPPPPSTNVETNTDELDWTFQFDYRALLKFIKATSVADSTTPFVVIALPEQFSMQRQALKDWAEKHTSPRSVFVLDPGGQEWSEFLRYSRPSDPSILLFHEGTPSFTRLPDFSKLLHKDELVCHTVSWTIDSQAKKALYNVSPMFHRYQHLFLIPEATMLSQPALAAYAINWFGKQNAKKPYGKLVVRPNIQEYLRYRALEAVEEKNQQQANEMLKLLEHCSEFSPAIDVTNPGVAAAFGAALGGEDLVTRASFEPFPDLPGYDHTATADITETAVAKRDEYLLDYFVNLTVADAGRFRKLLVLYDGTAKQTADSHHIVFRSINSWVNEVGGHKPKENGGKK